MIGHKPNAFSTRDILKTKANYNKTLKIYAQLFGPDIPIEIWRKPDFENPINEYRLISLWDYIKIKGKIHYFIFDLK